MRLDTIVDEILNNTYLDNYELDKIDKEKLYKCVILFDIEKDKNDYLHKLINKSMECIGFDISNKKIESKYNLFELVKKLLFLNEHETPNIKDEEKGFKENLAKDINYRATRLNILLNYLDKLPIDYQEKIKIKKDYLIKGLKHSEQSIRFARNDKTRSNAQIDYINFTRDLCYIRKVKKYINNASEYLDSLMKKEYFKLIGNTSLKSHNEFFRILRKKKHTKPKYLNKKTKHNKRYKG